MASFRKALALSFNIVTACALSIAGASGAYAAEPLDPSVIDPVGKLNKISTSVSQSSAELNAISQALDKLTAEMDRVDKDKSGKVSRASLDSLQKRFKETINRSYVVEKEVKDALAKDLRDIENVRQALTGIQKERQGVGGKTGAAGHRPVMTDGEIAECLKDLNDLSSTIHGLQQSLVDEEKAPVKKDPQNKTAGSVPRSHSIKGR